jgi:HTH-type transcriptional regulator/antitoxin HigA
MDIRPIKTARDYEQALTAIGDLMDAAPDTPEGDRLDVLATLVDAYEGRHFPIEKPDPVAAIRFRMEQLGMTRKDLEPLIGARGRVAEVLNGKRGLSLEMIRKLHDALNIPASVLIQDPARGSSGVSAMQGAVRDRT